MKAVLVTALACLAALAFVPGKAAAIRCAPPGTSGVDQYFESIPGGSCNLPPPGCGSTKAGRRDLSPNEVRRLTSEGAAGRAVIGSVSSYAPPIPTARQSVAPTTAGANPVLALGRLMVTGSSTTTGGGGGGPVQTPCPTSNSSGTGAGLLLPILLAVALAGAIAAVVIRRRRAEPSPA